MFEVRHKETNKIYKVFAVKSRNLDTIWFLIYRNDEWKWVISKYYEPVFVDIEKLALMANHFLLNEGDENNA